MALVESGIVSSDLLQRGETKGNFSKLGLFESFLFCKKTWHVGKVSAGVGALFVSRLSPPFYKI